MTGMVQGGWEYVGLAWGVTLVVLAAYGIRLQLQLMKERS